MTLDNPFMKRAAARTNTEHGNKSEKRLAKSIGAKLHPASGALKGAKSDMTLGKFRMESKSTTSGTLPIDLGWLTKIGHEASANGTVPALTLSFVDQDGKPRTDRNAEWVALPLWAFLELVEGA